jgi:hypothetical protein
MLQISAIGAVLSQRFEKRLHLIAFYSRKIIPAEQNYDIHDKKMLAIVQSMVKWHSWVHGAKHQVLVYSNHESLKYFERPRLLCGRQVRWVEKLIPYDYLIFYQKGSSNGRADDLSCNQEYRLKERGANDDEKELGNQFKFGALDLVLANNTITTGAKRGDDLGSINISSSQINKPKAEFIKKCSELNTAEEMELLGNEWSLISGLWYKNQLIRPLKALLEEIVTMEHQQAHGGRDKTIEVIKRNFDIPNL